MAYTPASTNEKHNGTAPQPLLVDRKTAAGMLGISLRLLDTYLANKTIPRVKLGRRALIRVDDLEEFVERLGDEC